MSIKITEARTPELIDEVFKIRYKVFVEEEKLLKENPDKRLIVRFDAYPTATNLVVICENQVVGSIRLTEDSAVGTLADKYYDFKKHLPQGSRIIHCGMFCVSQKYRRTDIVLGLLLMCSYFSTVKDFTHVVAPSNPAVANNLQKAGFQSIGDTFKDSMTGALIQPLILDILNLSDFFMNFNKKNQIHGFLDDYECIFYEQGEYILRAGEKGKRAFFVTEGIAQVKLPNSDKTIAELKRGEIFGELALLTDDIRSADVIAATKTQVMSISKSAFMKHFLDKPEQTIGLLKIIATRSKKMVENLDTELN